MLGLSTSHLYSYTTLGPPSLTSTIPHPKEGCSQGYVEVALLSWVVVGESEVAYAGLVVSFLVLWLHLCTGGKGWHLIQCLSLPHEGPRSCSAAPGVFCGTEGCELVLPFWEAARIHPDPTLGSHEGRLLFLCLSKKREGLDGSHLLILQ
jgi:hypothetical protein